MNICLFSGRLVGDCETRYTQAGTAVSNFTLAVDSGLGDYKRTDFIKCVLWKRENLAQYLTKGKPVIIQGEYQSRKYEDKEGNNRSAVEIVVRQVDFQVGDPRGTSGQQTGGNRTQSHSPQSKQSQNQQGQQSGNLDPFADNPGPAFPSESENIDEAPF